jgi:hypothetical protein
MSTSTSVGLVARVPPIVDVPGGIVTSAPALEGQPLAVEAGFELPAQHAEALCDRRVVMLPGDGASGADTEVGGEPVPSPVPGADEDEPTAPPVTGLTTTSPRWLFGRPWSTPASA